jgi:hypothetical protein
MRDNFTAGGQEKCFGEDFPQKLQLLVNDDNFKIINELLTSEPTIEMKNVYGTENINDIRMQWNETIELALKTTMFKGKNKEIIARIFDKILIKK